MEVFGIFKFKRNAAAGAEVVSSDTGDLRNMADDDGDTDSEDSFFDLVIKSPDRVAARVEEGEKKDFRFIESPRDVFLSKNDFSISNAKPLSPASFLRSTRKFRVFMLGFRKSSKCERTESNGELKCSTPLNLFLKSSKIEQSNRFSVERRVQEMAVASILARDNSLRSHLLKETSEYDTSSEKSSRDAVPKYLKLIKPLYLKVSKRQNKKANFTDLLTPSSSPVMAPVDMSPRELFDGSRVGSFKIMAKHLGKSRSVSGAVGVAPPPPPRRRDDSLLEQNDGIQGAILYCKKSYSSSSKDFSQLFRSSSDPSHKKLGHLARNSCEEQKRCSI